jgi:uncharacterized membrane protein
MTETTSRSPSHSTAVAQALLVTFLWSTSWVLIKLGLKDIPALTFAGIRYSLAFLCLVFLAMSNRQIGSLRHLSLHQWGKLIALGIFYYTITQGSQFYGLAYLPAITVSLLLNFTTLIVALFGILWLAEKPSFINGWELYYVLLRGWYSSTLWNFPLQRQSLSSSWLPEYLLTPSPLSWDAISIAMVTCLP